MKRMMGGAALMAAMMVVVPVRTEAQAGPGARGIGMAPRGAGVEMLLRQRERLELTEDQIARLERIRQEAVERRTAHQAQVAELRSRVAAGQLEVAAFREQVRAIQEGAEGIREEQRTRTEAVLNDAQKEQIEQWRGQARAYRAGRMSAMRGQRGVAPQRGFGPQRGMAPGQGMRPGVRGQRPGMGMRDGFGPAFRQRWAPGNAPRMGPGGRRGPWIDAPPGVDTLPRR